MRTSATTCPAVCPSVHSRPVVGSPGSVIEPMTAATLAATACNAFSVRVRSSRNSAMGGRCYALPPELSLEDSPVLERLLGHGLRAGSVQVSRHGDGVECGVAERRVRG